MTDPLGRRLMVLKVGLMKLVDGVGVSEEVAVDGAVEVWEL